MDRKIFEDRLTYKETTITGHTALARIITKFNAFINAAVAATKEDGGGGDVNGEGGGGGGGGGQEAARDQYDSLMKEMKLMRLEIDKAQAIFAQLPKERDEFDHYVEHIQQQTQRAEEEISTLKEQLLTERQIRLQREEYEALGKLVNQFPAKAITTVEHTKVAQEIEGMEEEKARLEEAVSFRKRQLAFVLNAVRDLKEGLDYDLRTDEEKERFLAEKAAALAKMAKGGGGGSGGGGGGLGVSESSATVGGGGGGGAGGAGGKEGEENEEEEEEEGASEMQMD